MGKVLNNYTLTYNYDQLAQLNLMIVFFTSLILSFGNVTKKNLRELMRLETNNFIYGHVLNFLTANKQTNKQE